MSNEHTQGQQDKLTPQEYFLLHSSDIQDNLQILENRINTVEIALTVSKLDSSTATAEVIRMRNLRNLLNLLVQDAEQSEISSFVEAGELSIAAAFLTAACNLQRDSAEERIDVQIVLVNSAKLAVRASKNAVKQRALDLSSKM